VSYMRYYCPSITNCQAPLKLLRVTQPYPITFFPISYRDSCPGKQYTLLIFRSEFPRNRFHCELRVEQPFPSDFHADKQGQLLQEFGCLKPR
jgi:hypothetical protein